MPTIVRPHGAMITVRAAKTTELPAVPMAGSADSSGVMPLSRFVRCLDRMTDPAAKRHKLDDEAMTRRRRARTLFFGDNPTAAMLAVLREDGELTDRAPTPGIEQVRNSST